MTHNVKLSGAACPRPLQRSSSTTACTSTLRVDVQADPFGVSDRVYVQCIMPIRLLPKTHLYGSIASETVRMRKDG